MKFIDSEFVKSLAVSAASQFKIGNDKVLALLGNTDDNLAYRAFVLHLMATPGLSYGSEVGVAVVHENLKTLDRINSGHGNMPSVPAYATLLRSREYVETLAEFIVAGKPVIDFKKSHDDYFIDTSSAYAVLAYPYSPSVKNNDVYLASSKDGAPCERLHGFRSAFRDAYGKSKGEGTDVNESVNGFSSYCAFVDKYQLLFTQEFYEEFRLKLMASVDAILHPKTDAVPESPKKDSPKAPAIDGIVGMENQVAALHVAMVFRKPAMLVGPTGCGKTHLVRAYCDWDNKERAKTAQPPLRLVVHTFHQDSSPSEIIGTKTLVGGNVVWQDSEFMKTFENGGTYFADEFNFAPGGAHAPLFAALNGDMDIFVPEADKTYKRHPDFRFVAACNPAGKYANRLPVDKALASRFFVSVEFGYLNPVDEKRLVMERVKGIDAASAERVVKYAIAVREAEKDGRVFVPFGTRDVIHVAELLSHGFEWAEAAKLGFANKSESDEQKNDLITLAGVDVKADFRGKQDYVIEAENAKKEAEKAKLETAKAIEQCKAILADLKKAQEVVKKFDELKKAIS